MNLDSRRITATIKIVEDGVTEEEVLKMLSDCLRSSPFSKFKINVSGRNKCLADVTL